MKMDDGIEKGIVKSYENGVATVVVGRTDACDSCMISGMCMGKDKTVEHRIKTDMSLKPGDCVRIEISAVARVFSSFVVFIVPILMMVLFFSVARYFLNVAEVYSILISIGGLIFSGLIIYGVDQMMAGKIRVEILEILEES